LRKRTERLSEESAAMDPFPRTLRSPYIRARKELGQLLFERRYGVHTAEPADADELGIAGAELVHYRPANWRTLRRTLKRREIRPDDAFLDLGSGKGRMVLEAARFPFRRVIGVELSEQLHHVACENIALTRQRLRCEEIDLVRADALDYEIPDDVTVMFLNDPFRGSVFAAVARNMIASADKRPRKMRVIYQNPVEEDFLLGTGRFRPLRSVAHAQRSPAEPHPGLTRVYELARGLVA
jgi:16S rRNA G966 N2-methylase RsmD